MKREKSQRRLFRPGLVAALICLLFGLGFFLGAWTLRRSSAPVTVVSRGEAVAVTDAAQKRVNLNTADAETLQTLPGIGPALAERIIAYRAENGPFTYPYEITDISGIGSATYEKLRELITTDPE